MRFIDNKEKLAPLIYEALQKSAVIESKRKQIFCDCFAGSVSMGRFFKQKGFSVISCDMLYFSYCLQKAYLHKATMPKFLGLHTLLDTKNAINPYTKVLEYLNNIESKIGFISTHYAPTLSEKMA